MRQHCDPFSAYSVVRIVSVVLIMQHVKYTIFQSTCQGDWNTFFCSSCNFGQYDEKSAGRLYILYTTPLEGLCAVLSFGKLQQRCAKSEQYRTASQYRIHHLLSSQTDRNFTDILLYCQGFRPLQQTILHMVYRTLRRSLHHVAVYSSYTYYGYETFKKCTDNISTSRNHLQIEICYNLKVEKMRKIIAI